MSHYFGTTSFVIISPIFPHPFDPSWRNEIQAGSRPSNTFSFSGRSPSSLRNRFHSVYLGAWLPAGFLKLLERLRTAGASYTCSRHCLRLILQLTKQKNSQREPELFYLSAFFLQNTMIHIHWIWIDPGGNLV